MKQICSIAMLSPYVHPMLVIISHTGGLSLLVEKTLKYLFQHVLHLEQDKKATFEDLGCPKTVFPPKFYFIFFENFRGHPKKITFNYLVRNFTKQKWKL